MRRKLILLICFALAASLYGCKYKAYYGRTPCYQPNTTWISEDESIVIRIDSDQQGTGVLLREDEEIDFIFLTSGPVIYLFAPEAEDRLGRYPEEQYEKWYGEYKYNDRFTAIVQETTFFEKGDIITFYRMDNE